ncbi:Uncharacterized protein HZ326_15824 [Fusarium oxysporum f. sp. albedinis]|nr:Uncharacterized protein HZ326_15824 [Fusarium oxysporum f. sp. albedinis]
MRGQVHGLDSRSESQLNWATAGPGLLLYSSNPTHYGVPTLGSLGPGNTPDSSKARPPRPDQSESFLFHCDISLLSLCSSYLKREVKFFHDALRYAGRATDSSPSACAAPVSVQRRQDAQQHQDQYQQRHQQQNTKPLVYLFDTP